MPPALSCVSLHEVLGLNSRMRNILDVLNEIITKYIESISETRPADKVDDR